jgi:hypothetical protein
MMRADVPSEVIIEMLRRSDAHPADVDLTLWPIRRQHTREELCV